MEHPKHVLLKLLIFGECRDFARLLQFLFLFFCDQPVLAIDLLVLPLTPMRFAILMMLDATIRVQGVKYLEEHRSKQCHRIQSRGIDNFYDFGSRSSGYTHKL